MVEFCNWCPDPHHPDPACHPDGGLEHRETLPSLPRPKPPRPAKRDINRVLSYILRRIIPQEETEAIAWIKKFYDDCFYIAPECQNADLWMGLSNLLTRTLGSSVDSEWKTRVGKVVRNEEKIPDDFHELGFETTWKVIE